MPSKRDYLSILRNEVIHGMTGPETVELRTSSEWQSMRGDVIMDPDGWDRRNYEFSFYKEKISLSEYEHRLSLSTMLIRGK